MARNRVTVTPRLTVVESPTASELLSAIVGTKGTLAFLPLAAAAPFLKGARSCEEVSAR